MQARLLALNVKLANTHQKPVPIVRTVRKANTPMQEPNPVATALPASIRLKELRLASIVPGANTHHSLHLQLATHVRPQSTQLKVLRNAPIVKMARVRFPGLHIVRPSAVPVTASGWRRVPVRMAPSTAPAV